MGGEIPHAEEGGVKAVCPSSCKTATATDAGSVAGNGRETATLGGARNAAGHESNLKES